MATAAILSQHPAALNPVLIMPQPQNPSDRQSQSRYCRLAITSLRMLVAGPGPGCWSCRTPRPRCHLAAQRTAMPGDSGHPGLKASFLPAFQARGAVPQKKALSPSKGFCSHVVACPESAAFISSPSVSGCSLPGCRFGKTRSKSQI